ncbi:hypothetical protein C8R47DRAFT_1210827 [Mycena vitilis]|nr:hypothetical protein C8R47DRAFT_1210827 [Mycena vitilis]
MIPLPPELIVAIAALIDDSDSLKAYSLVCKAFVAPAQRILLRSLRIQQIGSGRWQTGTGPRGDLSIQRAHAALNISPHISSYIRHLTLHFAGPPLNDDEQGPLKHILSTLCEIEDLVISGSASVLHNPFATSLLPSFLALLEVPTFCRLYLSNFKAVPRAFISCAMATTSVLFLQNIGLMDTDTDARDFTGYTGTPRLERLIFRGRTLLWRTNSLLDFVLDVKNVLALRHVNTLEVPMAPGVPTVMQNIIAATAPSLRHLVIDYGDCYHSRTPGGLQLPPLPGLRSIELTLFLGWVRRLPPDLYTTLASFPDVIPNIRRIKLIFVLDSLEQQVAWQDGSTEFALFDAKCAWRARLPRLRRLDCCLDVGAMESNPQAVLDAAFAQFVASMEVRFPGLKGKGILTFSRGGELEEWVL